MITFVHDIFYSTELMDFFSLQIPIIKQMCPNIRFVFNTRHPKTSMTSFYRMATSPVFVSSLKYEVKQMMHQLPPLPYDDSTGVLRDFRHHILEKVNITQ